MNDDSISRDAVLDACSQSINILDAMSRIEDLPSVTPKPCEDCISRAWLKGAIHNFYYGLKHTPTEEDIQAYIDAAPSVTPKPCEDAISRQAVWDVMQELWGTSGELLDRLMALPSVTPKQRTGHWIYGEDNLGTGRDGWYCNQCGHFEFLDYSLGMKNAKLNLPNPCPNCGAKMEEQE